MNASIAQCAECRAEIAADLLACPGCARLVHSAELTRLAGAAQAAEAEGELASALASWRRAIELLPPHATQRTSIEAHMAGLSAAIDGRDAPAGSAMAAPGKKSGARAGKAAGLGAVGLALLKAKAVVLALLAHGKLLLLGLTKLPTLLSMLVYLRWTGGAGVGFGLGLVACLYVHEAGHVATLRRYGIEATAPMFVPGFGAFVRMKQYPTDAHEEARTGLAGPLWGLVASGVAAAVGAMTGSAIALGVAAVSAKINLFNLVPFWQLDGARGLRALSRGERLVVAGVGVAAALALHQWLPLAVGALAGARAFGADAHPKGDRRALALFVALIVAHGALAAIPIDGATTPPPVHGNAKAYTASLSEPA